MIRRALPALLAVLVLPACAGRAIDAPSLAQRDFEKQAVPVPDEASEPAAALDPALATRLKALLDQATAAHADFSTAERKAAAAMERASGTAAGGETWTVAQQELSALDAKRGPLQAIAADVDTLRADPANATPGNRAAIDTLAANVDALGDQENAAVTALSAKLRP